MMNVRMIDRAYAARDFSRLLHDLTSHRADALVQWDPQASRPVLAAAMSAIRLDELSQAHHPFCGKLLQIVLKAQEADGGWGDPLTSALCLRALMANRGDGVAIERGLAYLAALQQEEGSFPAGPFRRMPADAHVTAAILYFLGEYAAVYQSIHVSAAADWLNSHTPTMNDATRVLWRHGKLRCRLLVTAPSNRNDPRLWAQVA
jgi:hypothetical protein